jgi:hypothetical protein
MENKENFQIGDKVYDQHFGWGEVINISTFMDYPITVSYGNKTEIYTREGKIFNNLKPTLSHVEYQTLDQVQVVKSRIKAGDLVLVTDPVTDTKYVGWIYKIEKAFIYLSTHSAMLNYNVLVPTNWPTQVINL